MKKWIKRKYEKERIRLLLWVVGRRAVVINCEFNDSEGPGNLLITVPPGSWVYSNVFDIKGNVSIDWAVKTTD